MKHKIIAPKLIIPWEDKPKDCPTPIWRYSKNPIVKRNPIRNVSRVFNSAVVPFEGEFVGIFRGDTFTTIPNLFIGRSKDGINFKFDENKESLINKDNEVIFVKSILSKNSLNFDEVCVNKEIIDKIKQHIHIIFDLINWCTSVFTINNYFLWEWI